MESNKSEQIKAFQILWICGKWKYGKSVVGKGTVYNHRSRAAWGLKSGSWGSERQESASHSLASVLPWRIILLIVGFNRVGWGGGVRYPEGNNCMKGEREFKKATMKIPNRNPTALQYFNPDHGHLNQKKCV